MSHVLIIGKKFTALTDYLTQNGHSYTLLQDELATRYPSKRFRNRIVADFSTRDHLLTSLSELKQTPELVVATYENYVLPAAWIADHLSLPGLPISVAEACTDKFLMRTSFSLAPEKISPAFAIVENETDIVNFANNHDFPLILKPANLAKSLLVIKIHDMQELLASYRKSMQLLSSTYKKYAPNRIPKLIVEEFLEGSIHSVDAFIGTDGVPIILEQIVDYQTGYDIGYDDNFHYSRTLPSVLSAEGQHQLRRCAKAGIVALGMKNSPAHVEIIMTSQGPRIVEIGARNGGYRERMHKLANGIDITGAALAVASGATPDIKATKSNSCAVLELFAKESGTFVGISNVDQLRRLPSLQYLSIKTNPGDYSGKSSDGYKADAVIVLSHDSKEQFEKDSKYIDTNCSVITTQ